MLMHPILYRNVSLTYYTRNIVDVSDISRKFYFSNLLHKRHIRLIDNPVFPFRNTFFSNSVYYLKVLRGSIFYADRNITPKKNSQEKYNGSDSSFIGRYPKMKRANNKASEHAHNEDRKECGFKIHKWGLNEWSNFAAILCAIDCTLLPLITAVLPIVGFLGDAESLHSFHDIAEWLALVVVIPLAGFASVANYLQIKRLRLFILSLFGICLVFLSHNHALMHSLPEDISELVHNHHTLLSLIGACCLLSSNYISHTLKHSMKKSCCHEPCKEEMFHKKNCSKGNYTLLRSRNSGDSQSD